MKFPPRYPIEDRLLITLLAQLESQRPEAEDGASETNPLKIALDIARNTSFEAKPEE